MSKRAGIVLLAIVLILILAGCGRKKGPTPVPTVAGATVIPLTPTQGPTVPALPKYLPTSAPTPASTVPPTQPMLEATPPTIEVLTIGVTPTVVEPRVEVVVNQAIGYNGPGETYTVIGLARAGDQLIVEERSPDGKWLHVCCFAGRPGWIALQDVRPLTDLDQVPVASVIPQPPGASPLPSPTPMGE